jgi:hypothetical protein
MNKKTVKVLAGFIIVVLIIAGIALLIIYWPIWFPEDKTPTNHLRLEVEKEEGKFVYKDEVVDIFFKQTEESKRFKFYDVLGKREGGYQYTKGKKGESDHLTLHFDGDQTGEEWNIKLKKGEFEGSKGDGEQEGEYIWISEEIDPKTNTLRLIIESDNTVHKFDKGDIINIIFDDGEYTMYYKSVDIDGDYIYSLDEDTDEELLNLNHDEDDDANYYYYSWFIVLWSGTNFTAKEAHGNFDGTYVWV